MGVRLMPRQHNAAAIPTGAGSNMGVCKVWPEYSSRGPPARSFDSRVDPGQQPPHARKAASWEGGTTTLHVGDSGPDRRITCPDIDTFGGAAWREQRWLGAGSRAKCLGAAGAITPSITEYA